MLPKSRCRNIRYSLNPPPSPPFPIKWRRHLGASPESSYKKKHAREVTNVKKKKQEAGVEKSPKSIVEYRERGIAMGKK